MTSPNNRRRRQRIAHSARFFKDLRGTEAKNSVRLGNLGLLLDITEDGVLVELGVETVELGLERLLSLLNVGVVQEVLSNLLSLRCRHLGQR